MSLTGGKYWHFIIFVGWYYRTHTPHLTPICSYRTQLSLWDCTFNNICMLENLLSAYEIKSIRIACAVRVPY